MQEQFIIRSYDSSSIETKIKKIKLLDKKDLLTPKTTQKVQVLPLIVTYNCKLPNIKQIIQNRWSILTNKALEKTFFSWTNCCFSLEKQVWNNLLEEVPSKTIRVKKKITHMWRRWGTPQNLFLAFIDELEKQIIF